MNKNKRERLRQACELLDRASGIIDGVRYDEQSDLDNMPENLENSERCIAMEEAVDNLEEAIESISEAQESIYAAM